MKIPSHSILISRIPALQKAAFYAAVLMLLNFYVAAPHLKGQEHQKIAPQADSSNQIAPTQEGPIQEVANVFIPVDLSGTWKGTWVSCKSGHNGKLRATFCRLNDKQVQAVFVGSFAKILPFRYKAVLDIVHEESGMIVVRGSKRLGPLMGTFSYQATITEDRFDATYNSKRDWGKWSMSRCCK